MTTKPKRRRRGEDRSELPMSVFLPPNNRPAGRAYVCGIVGLFPGVGLILGPLGVIFGLFGYRLSRREPSAKGAAHAVVGVVLGTLELVVNLVGWALIAVGLGWL